MFSQCRTFIIGLLLFHVAAAHGADSDLVVYFEEPDGSPNTFSDAEKVLLEDIADQ